MDVTYLECNNENVSDSDLKKYEEYTLDDCILVRTTDAFPFNGIVETPEHGNAFVYGDSCILGDSIGDIIRAKYPNRSKSEEDRNNFFKEFEECKVVSKSYRSTIHFTINGLVSSHLYGDFSDRSFVIMEPLKKHIQDSSLLSLNACDTYFDNDMKLSNEAVIIIEKNVYEQIKDIEEYKEVLKNMDVYVYAGNQEEAVSRALNDYGYDAFNINDHGYVNGLSDHTAANKMWCFLDELRKEYNLEAISHFGSEYNYKDKQKIDVESEKTDMKNFLYIFERAVQDNLLDEELIDNVNTSLELDKDNNISYLKEKYEKYNHFGGDYRDYGKSYLLKLVPNLVEKIGLDKLKQYIKDFNTLYIDNKLDNILDTKMAFHR